MPPLSNKHVLIMGLGRFGGGAGVARFAEAHARRVTITDPADNLDTAPIQDLLDAGSVDLIQGPHNESLLDDADILVVNPAVPHPWRNPFINAARDRDIPITTEIALAIPRLTERLDTDSRIIAVTGTAGKSTTAAMIHHALRSLGKPAILAGNIGGSLLNTLDPITPDTTPVLELSSAQLHWLRQALPDWSPHVAVVTSYEPNHIDWHETEHHYLLAKQHILAKQPPGHHAVLAEQVAAWPTNPGVLTPPVPDIHPHSMALPGAHNLANAALATAAITALGLPKHNAARATASFPGLPHRLQSLGTRRGVLAVNDSKSTTPASTAIAVAALRERSHNIHLIAGGADKGADLSPLARLPVAAVYTIGSTGPAIAAACLAEHTPVTQSTTLERATAAAIAAARKHPQGVVLLSPACASWDQYPNYQARGQHFADLISNHLGAPDATKSHAPRNAP